MTHHTAKRLLGENPKALLNCPQCTSDLLFYFLLAKEIHYSILHKSLFQLFCLMGGSPYIKFLNFSTYRLTASKIK